MSVFSTLQDVRASVALTVATAFGLTAAVNHRAGGNSTIYVRFLASGDIMEQDGDAVIDKRWIKLQVPVQTGCADEGNSETMPLTFGDFLTWRGRTYGITEIDRDDKDRTFTVTAVQSKHLSLGAVP